MWSCIIASDSSEIDGLMQQIETSFSFSIEPTDPGSLTSTISLDNRKIECDEGVLLPCDFK
jgi:hypothetical protein